MLSNFNLSISTSHMFATALFAWSDDGIGKFSGDWGKTISTRMSLIDCFYSQITEAGMAHFSWNETSIDNCCWHGVGVHPSKCDYNNDL